MHKAVHGSSAENLNALLNIPEDAVTECGLTSYLTFSDSRHMLIANFGEQESGPCIGSTPDGFSARRLSRQVSAVLFFSEGVALLHACVPADIACNFAGLVRLRLP